MNIATQPQAKVEGFKGPSPQMHIILIVDYIEYWLQFTQQHAWIPIFCSCFEKYADACGLNHLKCESLQACSCDVEGRTWVSLSQIHCVYNAF